MAVGAIPCTERGSGMMPTRQATNFMLPPQAALFLAIDLHCGLHRMGAEGEAPRPDDDKVTYFVNKDSQGWVQQIVRRRVYIELKLECT